jgi:RNA polymerase sigma-70 factor (sigma-E family)
MDRDGEFSEFVASRWPRLVRSAVLLGCSPAEAEDVVQSTLERCLLKWTHVQRSSDRNAYVNRILFNTFTSSRRRRWTGERPAANLPDRLCVDETNQVDDVDAVLRALRRLPQDQRVVVVMRYYAHLTEEQMAIALDVAPGTVKSRLARAIKALSEDPSLYVLRGGTA